MERSTETSEASSPTRCSCKARRRDLEVRGAPPPPPKEGRLPEGHTEVARVAIGLGSNLSTGDEEPLTLLRRAAERIGDLVPILARSRVWQTDPIGGPPQPPFLNAAVL